MPGLPGCVRRLHVPSRQTNELQAGALAVELAFDQLDLVAIGIRNESDHGVAAFYGTGLTRDVAAIGARCVTGSDDIFCRNGDMAISRAQVVAAGAVVIGQFQFRVVRVRTITNESQGVLVFRIVAGAQQLHAQHFGVKIDRTLQVADPQHGVQNTHGKSLMMIGEWQDFMRFATILLKPASNYSRCASKVTSVASNFDTGHPSLARSAASWNAASVAPGMLAVNVRCTAVIA